MLGEYVRLQKPMTVDVARLVETRLLVQANSGGGKSYMLRKMLEETYGKVPQVVLDVEGEFSTLREKYDYLLVGKGGDLATDIRTSELLARKVLELECSIIIDLYELKHHERVQYVRLFINSLMSAPKELWHPLMVVIDEAHLFAPEKGQSDAADAVRDLATRGRKRGFCAVLATQRLSKLDKDVAAECLNKLVGRTSLDIDMKRAADELGFNTREHQLALRALPPGNFWAYGPAFNHEAPEVMYVGKVKTTHPQAGKRLQAKTPVATAHVRSIISKLADLPKAAQAEVEERAALKTRVRELEGKLRQQPLATPSQKVLNNEFRKGYERGVQEARANLNKKYATSLHRAKHSFETELNDLKAFVVDMRRLGDELNKDSAAVVARLEKEEQPPAPRGIHPQLERVVTTNPLPDGVERVGKCERAILGFLSSRPDDSFTKLQVAAMTGYRADTGGFNNALGKLRSLGLITGAGNDLQVMPEKLEEARELARDFNPTLEHWVKKLGKCERAIYDIVREHPGTVFKKEEIAQATGYIPDSGGFNNAVGRLNTLGLIRRERGEIQLNEETASL